MKFGITAKVFCAILAACALVLLINGVGTRIGFERGFLGYLNDQGIGRMERLLPRLQSEYARHGDWNFVRGHPEIWFDLLRPDDPEGIDADQRTPPVSDQSGAVFRFALLDAQGHRIAGNPSVAADAIRRPIVVDHRTVGWMAMVPFQRVLAGNEQRFVEQQKQLWWGIGIASVLVAALVALALSRALLRRVRGLAAATQRLAAGDYAVHIDAGRQDEIGQLAKSFNQMADTLEHTEQTRRAFMADISHELRTPLAVLRAELEAIQDGIRPMTPATLAPLQAEVGQLGKLIDDLHDLALTQSGAMAYRLDTIDLGALLHGALAPLRSRFQQAGLTLRSDLPETPLRVQGDERRLQQLIANLMENALRYTDAGGVVTLSARQRGTQVQVVLDDSAPGVDADKRARLFERFYRVDASRNRASGGSGLGLAICQNIAQAHAGQLHADASPLGGLRIVLTLPAVDA
ncbi:sensor histidine kinase efflux regulator BaeS [Xanthomonas maliensis]|uniref:sensor histidine kinase efflux regulator BaeS n=1 Tax=Xanthomonas maliensis TaxID=1321368 RepID=UPI0003B4C19C|nr:sensor histidine kinase efflux regulator BaeS [Xanthomonas maliensis]KAB7764311.1 sensor histidine kinase efflux regulator BaeS [Xanthomonas maliensis]